MQEATKLYIHLTKAAYTYKNPQVNKQTYCLGD